MRRREMVRSVRAGKSMRAVAAASHVHVSTVSFWVERAQGRRLDRVDFSDHNPGRAWNRIATEVEQRVVELRMALRKSILGEYGARAIRLALQAEMACPPSAAAINRTLARLGLQDGARRIRRPAPPQGWYLPPVMAGHAELDCFDFIEELKIAKGPLVHVLTAKSLHGALTNAWVVEFQSTKGTLPYLLERWQRDGLPAYAQFDNGNVFQGAHHFVNAVGAVSRLCLQLKVIPVFVPPLEHGMQNTIESFNGLWQAKVWQRHRVTSVSELQGLSDQYIAAHRARTQPQTEAAPPRRLMPSHFKFDPRAPLRGQLIFLRRTDESGRVTMLGQRFTVSQTWSHRLVRCEVDLDQQEIRCIALRRREPAEQPLLITIPYQRLDKPFRGRL